MDTWCLYEGAADQPKRWTVRLWKFTAPTDVVFSSDSRNACEKFVLERHPGAVWLMPSPEDDPKIVGAWI